MSFPSITLLECNREQSVQKGSDSDNNAIFTNRMGSVINLDIGDTIEVKSAFINKRGCANPDSIEFKGSDLGVEATFTRTTISTTEPTSYNLDNKYPELLYNPLITDPSDQDTDLESTNNKIRRRIPQDRIAFRQIYNETTKKSLKDNRAFLETQLYKTSDGESYCFLPRNFIRSNGDDIVASSPYQDFNRYIAYYSRPNFDLDVVNSDTPSAFVYHKGQLSGISRYYPEDSIFFGRCFGGFDNYKDMFLRSDYHFAHQNITYSGTNDDPLPTQKEEREIYTDTDEDPNKLRVSLDQDYNELKPKNDCSRYFLFEREYDWMMWPTEVNGLKVPFQTFINNDGTNVSWDAEQWFNTQEDPATYPLPSGFPKKYLRAEYRSPALFNYVKRVKLNEISVNKGYSTPQSIAEQITKQLQSQQEGSPYIYEKKDEFNYSTAIQTGYYEPVNCANVGFQLWGYRHYFHYELDTETHDPELAFDWWKSFHNILIKRPDLYETGTKINNRFGFVGTPAQQSAVPPDDPSNPSDNTNFGIGNYIWNDIEYDAVLKNNIDQPIKTGWLYTEDNLKKLSELFDIQAKYPELFFDSTKSLEHNLPFLNRKIEEGNQVWGTPATIENSRFLHINRFDINIHGGDYDGGNMFNILGDDGYVPFTYNNGEEGASLRTFDTDHRATAFFFKYDKTYRNIDTGGDDINRLSYGFATKELINDGARSDYYIVLHPELVNGLRPDIFNMRGGMQPFTIGTGGDDDIAVWDAGNIKGRKNNSSGNDFTIIGWDYHFSSWGNVVMCATNGMPLTRATWDGEAFFVSTDNKASYSDPEAVNVGYSGIDREGLRIEKSYLGANDIALEYDGVSNRFGFSYLHRPTNIGNKFDAGSTDFSNSAQATPLEKIPINDNAGEEVIKINPRPYKWNFCNELVPYIKQNGEVASETTGSTKGRINIDPMNDNFSAWTIYDSRTGVVINFGKTADIDENIYGVDQNQLWNKSLLGILGFSYQQFNPKEITSKNNGLARVSNININSLYNPTTNSNFLNTNVNSYVMNQFGAVQYGNQIPFALEVGLANPLCYKYKDFQASHDKLPWEFLPPINVPADSVKIEGNNLPRVSLNPYITIRSDLIRPQKYIGGLNGGLTLPVCAVVNQINSEKDFLQLEGSEVYTITEPMKFSSITTCITDPDGTLSLLDEGSSVIYKITKADSLSRYNILEEFQRQLNKK